MRVRLELGHEVRRVAGTVAGTVAGKLRGVARRACSWDLFWWGACAAYIVILSGLDLKASMEIDRLCMQSGLLSGVWKNKHCNNAARDLENGPLALLDLVLARVASWRFAALVGVSAALTFVRRSLALGQRSRGFPAPVPMRVPRLRLPAAPTLSVVEYDEDEDDE